MAINIPANPFPGLRPFESHETHLFFGRDGQSEELLNKLKLTRLLAVVGTSGSGKSSLVRAGLLPALQGGFMARAGSSWRIALFRPGNDPIGNLAQSLMAPNIFGSGDEKTSGLLTTIAETTLRRSSLGLVEVVRRARMSLDQNKQNVFSDHENLVVVVDQFEELFRFKRLSEVEHSEEAEAFVKLLLEATQPQQREERIYVVLTMRSDYLGDCAQFADLAEAINNGQYLIPRMSRDERRAAITGPIAVGRGKISEPLVNQLLNDVGDNPDQLPILQHALMRTWNHWLKHRKNGEEIGFSNYQAIGEMAEALSQHADEAYDELSENRQKIAEKMFKCLTEKGPDNREIRRPMELKSICAVVQAEEEDVKAVIDVFRVKGRSFLMPPADRPLTADSLIDISHESLIRNWAKLKQWVNEEAQSAQTYRRLVQTAMLKEQKDAGLLQDPELGAALKWREKNNPNQAWAHLYSPDFHAAMKFLDESAIAREAKALKEEAQRKRKVMRAWGTAIVFAFLFILAAGSFLYANNQKNKLEEALKEAERQRSIAVGEQQKAEAAGQQAETAKKEAETARDDAKDALVIAEKAQKKAEEGEAEANRQKIRAENQTRLAQTLGGLGKTYRDIFTLLAASRNLNNDTDSELSNKWNSVLDIYKKNKDIDQGVGQLSTLLYLGDDYSQTLKKEDAINYYESAIPLIKIADKDKHDREVSTLLKIGDLYVDLTGPWNAVADAAKADEYIIKADKVYNEAADIYKGLGEKFKEKELDTLRKIIDKRPIIEGGKEMESSIKYYKRAAELAQAEKNSKDQVSWLIAIGDAYGQLQKKKANGELDEDWEAIKYLEAIKYYEKALPLLSDTEQTNSTLTRIAIAYRKSGDEQKAQEYFDKAFAVYRNDDITKIYKTIASKHISKGDFYREIGEQKAKASYDDALAVYHNAGDYSEEVSTAIMIGDNYREIDEKTANEYYNRALEVYQKNADRDNEITTLKAIVKLYFSSLSPQKAAEFYKQLASLARAEESPEEAAVTLKRIGDVHKEAGETEKAIQYYEMALPLSQASREYGMEALLLKEIGDLYATSDEKKADEYYEKVIEVYSKANITETNLSDGGISIITEIVSNYGKKDNQKAVDYFNRALQSFKPKSSPSDEAKRLIDVAEKYKELGAPQKADEYYGRAVDVYKKAGDRKNEISMLLQIAADYRKTKDDDRALSYYQRALSASEENLAAIRARGNRRREAETLSSIGDTYKDLGEKQKAIDSYKQALRLFEAMGDREKTSLTNQQINSLSAENR